MSNPYVFSLWVAAFEKVLRYIPNNFLGDLAVKSGKLVSQVTILMLDVRNSIGKAIFIVKEMTDRALLFMRLHEIVPLNTVCESIWSQRY